MNDEGVMQPKPSGGAKPAEELCEGHAAHGRGLSANLTRALRADSMLNRERTTTPRNARVAGHLTLYTEVVTWRFPPQLNLYCRR